jgi:hypothetical protein
MNIINKGDHPRITKIRSLVFFMLIKTFSINGKNCRTSVPVCSARKKSPVCVHIQVHIPLTFQGTEVIETLPFQGTEVIETLPFQGTEVIETLPFQGTEVIETLPFQGTEVIETLPSCIEGCLPTQAPSVATRSSL